LYTILTRPPNFHLKKKVPAQFFDGNLPFISLTNIFMKASRYLRVSLTKSSCEWCMGGRCITTTGIGKETIENSIMSGVATYNNWDERPDNSSERNKDDKMVPYLKHHFIYINYAKSVYYVGSGKATHIPSCVLEFIRDTVHDKKGIYRGRSFQLYGNRSPVREVLLMESERALRCIRTEMTNRVTNLGVYYELPCDCTLQNYKNGYIRKKYGKMFCETFIYYLARTCSKTVDFVTSHGEIEVDKESFMTMMFEAGKTYPTDDALGHECVCEGSIHDMDTHDARQKLNELNVKAIIEAPPEKQRRMKDGQQRRADALYGKRDPVT
jgi:hypothetical protein